MYYVYILFRTAVSAEVIAFLSSATFSQFGFNIY